MYRINNSANYLNQHKHARQQLSEKQAEFDRGDDSSQQLKHGLPTRCHSRLASLAIYLTALYNMWSAAEGQNISSSSQLHIISDAQADTVTEIIIILAKVGRVICYLEIKGA